MGSLSQVAGLPVSGAGTPLWRHSPAGLPEDWFTAAVDRLTAKHRRLPGPLIEHQPRPGESPPAQPLYRLADYLEQHSRRERFLLCPPTAFWEAATCHAHTPADLSSLAGEALVRGRYRHAARLAQRGVDAGDFGALRILVQVGEPARNQEEARRLYQRGVDAGDSHALMMLAQMREKAGGRTAGPGAGEGGGRGGGRASRPLWLDRRRGDRSPLEPVAQAWRSGNRTP